MAGRAAWARGRGCRPGPEVGLCTVVVIKATGRNTCRTVRLQGPAVSGGRVEGGGAEVRGRRLARLVHAEIVNGRPFT